MLPFHTAVFAYEFLSAVLLSCLSVSLLQKQQLDKKVKDLRLKMMTLMAAKQIALQAEAGGESQGRSEPNE